MYYYKFIITYYYMFITALIHNYYIVMTTLSHNYYTLHSLLLHCHCIIITHSSYYTLFYYILMQFHHYALLLHYYLIIISIIITNGKSCNYYLLCKEKVPIFTSTLPIITSLLQRGPKLHIITSTYFSVLNLQMELVSRLTRAILYCCANSNLFSPQFLQRQSRADKGLNLNMNIQPPLFWSTWSRASCPDSATCVGLAPG